MDLGQTAEAERLKGAMESSRASIAETVDELRGAVSQAMDWREHVKTHPAATLGVAAGAGIVLGHWLGGKIGGGDAPAAPRAAYAQPAGPTSSGLLDGSRHRAGARMESLVNLVIDEVADAVETAAIVPLFARLRGFLRTSAGAAGSQDTGAGAREGAPARSGAAGAPGDPDRRDPTLSSWAGSPPGNGRSDR